MQNFIEMGKKIYDTSNPREAHRMVVFVSRCCLHPRKMRRISTFFGQNQLLSQVAERFPFVYEQPTRAFFYNKSTFAERISIIEEHMGFLQEKLRDDVILDIYGDKKIPLWQMEIDGKMLELVLCIEPGQRKEGLLSLILFLGGEPLYQIVFWIAKSKRSGTSLFIGAMQGPNMADAKDVIKLVTKRCHSYRTKNLILYVTQALARSLGLEHIYAVTNKGYYAMNHVRRERKLKTSYSDFWMEAGGWHTKDDRFDELPLTEVRKSEEEVPTRKRAVYRRRFAMLDEIDMTIEENVKKLMK